MLINPLTFYYRPGMSLDERDSADGPIATGYAPYLGQCPRLVELQRVELTVLRRVLRTLGRSRPVDRSSAPGNSLEGDSSG